MEQEKRLDVRLVREYDAVIQHCGVFGVIIYSTANVHVKKVLFDEDYSQAIDSLVGDKWPVFTAYIDLRDYQALGGTSHDQEASGGKHFLIKEWMETQESMQLMDVFSITSIKRLPIMVVFAIDEDLKTRRRIFQIDDEDTSRVYEDLRYIITTVTDSLQTVDLGTSGWDKARLKLDVHRVWTVFQKGKDFVIEWILPFL